MQVTTIRYERLFNLGDYNNVKLGVEVTIEPGESPLDALERARKFVANNLKEGRRVSSLRQLHEGVMEQYRRDPDSIAPKALKEAQDWLADNIEEAEF